MSARREAAFMLREAGWTFARVGEALGISAARASQLYYYERHGRIHRADVRHAVALRIGVSEARRLREFAEAGGFDAFDCHTPSVPSN